MARNVLIDTSALVAALRRRDVHHQWARSHFEAATEPFFTCEAVISESFFLLERARQGKETLCALLERAVIVSRFSLVDELSETIRLLRSYDDTPMSFADACLVRMAEKSDDSIVFTADSDFRTYRKNGRQVIPLLTPE